MSAVSGQAYSSLFLVLSLSLLISNGLMFFNEKAHIRIYQAAALLFFIAAAMTFHSPNDKLAVFLFALFASTADMVGNTAYPMIISSYVRPQLFSNYYNQFISSDIASKVAASLTIIGLSHFGHLDFAMYIIGFLFAVHLFALWFVTRHEAPFLAFKNRSLKKSVTKIQSAIQFLKSNSLVKVALVILIWCQAVKFLVEYAFYQSLDATFTTKESIASFLSTLHLALNIFSFFLQPIIVKYISNRWPLTTALSLMPLSLMALGVVGLFDGSLAVTSFIFVLFYILFRGTHKPLAWQCFVPVPETIKRDLMILITCIIAIMNCTFGGLARLMRPNFDVDLTLMSLILLTASFFFFVGHLDAHYIRNLWRGLRDKTEADPEELWSDSMLTAVPMPESHLVLDESEKRFQRASLFRDLHREDLAPDEIGTVLYNLRHIGSAQVLADSLTLIYSHGQSPELLKRAVRLHRDTLFSRRLANPEPLLDLVGELKPSLKTLVFEKLAADGTYDYSGSKHYRTQWAAVDAFTSDLNLDGYNLLTRRHFRTVAQDIIVSGQYKHFLQKLKSASKLPPFVAQDMLEVLLMDKMNPYRQYVFECVTENGQFDLSPVLENFHFFTFDQAWPLRFIAAAMAKHAEKQIDEFVAHYLLILSRREFSLQGVLSGVSSDEDLDLFLHLVFLNEVILKPKSVSRIVRETLPSLTRASEAEQQTICDMHVRFLRKSRFSNQWRKLFA